MQKIIWVLLTRNQCTVPENLVTAKACGPPVLKHMSYYNSMRYWQVIWRGKRRCGSRDLNKKQMDDSLSCTQIETVKIFKKNYLHFCCSKSSEWCFICLKVHPVKGNGTELHNNFIASLLSKTQVLLRKGCMYFQISWLE